MQKNQTSKEEEIFAGPWGGSGGHKWSYKPQNGITEIHIFYDKFINSIMFVDGLGECSPKFGGSGGNQSVKININYPSEYLIGISGVHALLPYPSQPRAVKSLQFYTNTTKYGPFGANEGKGIYFLFMNENGHITGFHGRSVVDLDAIGIYAKLGSPVVIGPPIRRTNEFDIIKDVAPRDPGPWGDGKIITSPKYGGNGDCTVKQINIDYESDFLIGVSGFYGQMEYGGVNVIKSLTFYTNKGMYGPFGEEKGTYFTSVSCRGKILGFRGSSDEYLNAIGVHVQYI
ncbi:hypothetical protein RD792_000990 [Penstemon davidsonii]|uniref:Jacalin-type lectin domain-containing protein n=1 Tax=Penstemon davidsonii TaxID=160366 RepID=A0ABR0DM73_9LAMI|nr:hypothetical protein RD792_000990 [Penstemon davidsonii]